MLARSSLAWLAVATLTRIAPLIAQPARPLDAASQQALQFGTVLPGLATTISWSNAASAGQLDLRGTGGAQVRIDLTLPTGLAGTGGATLPVAFGPADGAYATQPSLNAATAFDPHLPLITTLSQGGRLYLRLGGTVTPGVTQPSGAYGGTITITVSYTGA